MRTLPSLLLSVALISATATVASAYSLSPPDISARLKGMVTFNPNEGSNTKPFTCKITLDLKTEKGKIESVKINTGVCEGVSFQNLPWTVFNLNANSGKFGIVSYISGDGNCEQSGVQFQDNASGIWTLPAGQCLSGTLTSTPPVTIVP